MRNGRKKMQKYLRAIAFTATKLMTDETFSAMVEQALPCIRARLFASEFVLNDGDAASHAKLGSLCDEFSLIEQVVNTVSFSWSSDPLLAIFQKHFLVRHCLYLIHRELTQQGQFTLDITPIGVRVLPLVTPHTQHLSEHSGQLASFYLDERHFFETDASEVGELIASFWRQYSASNNESGSLAVLGLSSAAGWSEIKARYREQVMRLHPDRGGDKHAFTKLQAAYSDLKRLRGK